MKKPLTLYYIVNTETKEVWPRWYYSMTQAVIARETIFGMQPELDSVLDVVTLSAGEVLKKYKPWGTK
jgi:hypothetical protein